MVSKCANPACSERFLYLHQGKIFQLTPTPEVEEAGGGFVPSLYERFWLCDQCCKQMTLVWAGTEAKVVPLPPPRAAWPSTEEEEQERPRKRAASAGLHWR
jgi:hypothetical protein